MGDHVVDLPAHAIELCPRLLKVALARQLLRPPAGIRDAVFLVHTRGAAHGKDRRPTKLKNLAARQAPYRRGVRQALRQSTVPQLQGALRPMVVAFVVAVDEQHGIGARLQPGDIGAFLGRKIPRKAKVSRDNQIVVARQTIPKLPVAELLHVDATVDITRHINRHRITTSLL